MAEVSGIDQEMLSMIREAEWSVPGFCTWCVAEKDEGHAPYCRFRTLMSRVEVRNADARDPELDHAVAEVKAAGG